MARRHPKNHPKVQRYWKLYEERGYFAAKVPKSREEDPKRVFTGAESVDGLCRQTSEELTKAFGEVVGHRNVTAENLGAVAMAANHSLKDPAQRVAFMQGLNHSRTTPENAHEFAELILQGKGKQRAEEALRQWTKL